MKQLTAELLSLKEELNHSLCHNHQNAVFKEEVSLYTYCSGLLKRWGMQAAQNQEDSKQKGPWL